VQLRLLYRQERISLHRRSRSSAGRKAGSGTLRSAQTSKESIDHAEKFGKKESFYINLSSADAKTVETVGKKNIESEDLISTSTLLLDNTHAVFANKEVRKALSMALDRDAIAKSLAVPMKPATALIPDGVENTKKGESFREKGGKLISTGANIAEAKKIVENEGVKGKFIAIEYSNARPNDELIANACKAAWEQIGFRVSITSRPQKYINSKVWGEYPMNQNNEALDYASVVIFDYQSVTYDAMGMLLPFSAKYGGHVIDVTTGPSAEDVVYNNHVSGYYSAGYDAICEKFVMADNNADRAAALHEAEKFIVDEMVVIPVLFNTSSYASQELSKMETDFYGRYNFTELKQKNFKKYLPKEED